MAELQGLIQQHYPTATCEVSPGDDPVGTYLIVTVDVEDTDAVVDVYIDRLLAFQIEEGLAVYVVPVCLSTRVLTPAMLVSREQHTAGLHSDYP